MSAMKGASGIFLRSSMVARRDFLEEVDLAEFSIFDAVGEFPGRGDLTLARVDRRGEFCVELLFGRGDFMLAIDRSEEPVESIAFFERRGLGEVTLARRGLSPLSPFFMDFEERVDRRVLSSMSARPGFGDFDARFDDR